MLRLFILLLMPFFSATLLAEELFISTADNAKIEADFIKRGGQTIILAHGADFNKDSWGGIATRLMDKNFSLLSINFRGYGNSVPGDKPDALYEDILAAIQYLKANQDNLEQISIMGSDIGAAAAADASIYADAASINRMILVSPTKLSQPEKLQGHLLFIANDKEPRIEMIREDFAKAPNNPKVLEVLIGSDQGQQMFDAKQKEFITNLVLRYFRQTSFAKSEKTEAQEAPAVIDQEKPETMDAAPKAEQLEEKRQQLELQE